MSIEPQQANRLRCRPIVESDLEGLADLLTRGFPRSRRDYWTAGFARWKNIPIVEGVPRYDNVFVIMLENKASSSILNSPFAPKINAYLHAGNQLTICIAR